MPSVRPDFATGGFWDWSYLRLVMRGAHSRKIFGLAIRAASDALVMVIGQRWPDFEFGRQIEARRPHLMAPARLLGAVLPDRGMQSARDAAAQQRVVGRMELHDVGAAALPVMRPERRRLGIGEAGEVLRLRRHDEAPHHVEILAHRLRKILGDLHQQRIAAPGIAAHHRRRLVGHLVRHASSFAFRERVSTLPCLAYSPRPQDRATKIPGRMDAIHGSRLPRQGAVL